MSCADDIVYAAPRLHIVVGGLARFSLDDSSHRCPLPLPPHYQSNLHPTPVVVLKAQGCGGGKVWYRQGGGGHGCNNCWVIAVVAFLVPCVRPGCRHTMHHHSNQAGNGMPRIVFAAVEVDVV